MDRTGFYILFIPTLAILAFLIGSAIAFIAMSGRTEPTDAESTSEAAH